MLSYLNLVPTFSVSDIKLVVTIVFTSMFQTPEQSPDIFFFHTDLASGLPRGSYAAPADEFSRPHGVKKSLHYTPSSKKGAMSVLDNLGEVIDYIYQLY